ncbi:MAG: methyltransferase, partial [Bacteroidetes bacterium]
IFAGNSLIASDFYDGGLFLTKKEERKINVFDWKRHFKNIMSLGGFDCMLGNPPYGASFSDLEKKYLKNKHKFSDIEIESYILFLEKSFDFLKDNGILGYIIPSNLFTNQRYKEIRSLLLNNSHINYLLDLGDGVFKEASVDTCITIFSKQKPNLNHIISGYVGNLVKNINYSSFLQNDFTKNKYKLFNIYTSSQTSLIAEKIAEKGEFLEKLVDFSRGVEFGYKSDYTTEKAKTKNAKPLIAGRCINKYKIIFENRYVIFDEKDVSNFKTKHIYESEKILVRRIGTEIIATFDDQKYYNVCDVYNLLSKNINLKYILGFLNSKLMSFYLQTQFKNAKKLFPKIPIAYLKQLPIIVLDTKNKNDKNLYDKIILHVETLLELEKRLLNTKTDSEKRSLNDRIFRNKEELDNLIFDLYALTDEEIKIILGE